jgi:hypothetical protein
LGEFKLNVTGVIVLMKTIKQLSTELGISKEAIYKKLKFQLKEQLANHVRKVDNVTRIDGEGELLIRQSLHRERREAIETVMETVVEDGALFEPPQAHLDEYVMLLREQIRTKDVQIETQSSHIGQLIQQLGLARLLPQAWRLNEISGGRRDEAPIAAARDPGGENANAAKRQGKKAKGKNASGRNGWKSIFGRRRISR